MKRYAAFLAACLTVMAGALAVLMLVYGQPDERRALWIGAGFALVVQLAAFSVVRLMSSRNIIAGWGLGVILRFGALALFALVVAPRLGLPLAAALLSVAIYLFLTTLVEPLFLAK